MSEFLGITLLIILATISPGPDFAMVTKNALTYSRKAGVLTALGVAASLCIHVTYCVLGLALLISESLWLFNLIKYVGAAYLIYIGIRCLFAKRELNPSSLVDDNNQVHTAKLFKNWEMFKQGLLCNLLNPKAIMFLIAFFTLVVKPGKALWIEWGYAVEIVLVSLVWFSTWSSLLTHPWVREKLGSAQFYIVKIMGVLLVLFGIRIGLM